MGRSRTENLMKPDRPRKEGFESWIYTGRRAEFHGRIARAELKNKAGARKKGEIDRMVNMARSTSIKSQKKAVVALEKIRCAQTD